MQLVELVRDVIANPTAYANAFPVSEPDVYGEYTTNFLEEMRRISSVVSDFTPIPGIDRATATGLAIQRDNENAYNRPPRGLPRARFSPWENGPDLYVDPTIDPNCIYFVRHPRHYGRRLDQSYWGDGSGEQAWLGPSENVPLPGRPVEFVEAERPDHYRVRGGRCACGFTSHFSRDMNDHINDVLVQDDYGVPKRWRVCARCGASRLCRQAAVARPMGHTSYMPEQFDPAQPPALTTEYRCDDCMRASRHVRD